MVKNNFKFGPDNPHPLSTRKTEPSWEGSNTFFSSGQAVDPFYNRVRDNPDRKEAHDFVEGLWQKYEPYAEPDFLDDARKDFHAKTWEMYLGCLFKDTGFNL